MKRSNSDNAAREFVLAKWSALPPEKRRTEDQAVMFAMKISHEHDLGIARDAYQTVLIWLKQSRSRD